MKPDLMQGTLDLLVLKILAQGAMHGYGIAQRILVLSRETLQVQQGSLYPALHRLEKKGLLRGEWKESENGRMAKLYALTASGRKALHGELEQWRKYTESVAWILEG